MAGRPVNGASLGRNDCQRAARGNSCTGGHGVVGPIADNHFNLRFLGDLYQQFRQDARVIHIAVRHQYGTDLSRPGIHA